MQDENTYFSKLAKLTQEKQNKVFNFIDFLSNQDMELPIASEEKSWALFSLTNAVKGMEDEPEIYSLDDIKEKF